MVNRLAFSTSGLVRCLACAIGWLALCAALDAMQIPECNHGCKASIEWTNHTGTPAGSIGFIYSTTVAGEGIEFRNKNTAGTMVNPSDDVEYERYRDSEPDCQNGVFTAAKEGSVGGEQLGWWWDTPGAVYTACVVQ